MYKFILPQKCRIAI